MQDVNRARVVTLATIAHAGAAPYDGPDLPAETPLAKAARILVDHPTVNARVVTAAGDTLGGVTLSDVVAGMSSGTNDTSP